MSTSLTTFFARVARDLHESDSTFDTSEFWTPEEMVGYLNYAEGDFLHGTGIIKGDTEVLLLPGYPILVDRPANTMDIVRISFNGRYLRRQTSWDFQKEDPEWRAKTTGNPSYWHEDHVPNSQFELNKIHTIGGTLRVFYDYRYDEYSDMTGNLNLMDIWEPYLRWKVLSLALGKDGDSQDLPRSIYADQRYRFGVFLAKRLMNGNPDISIPEQ